MVTAAEPTVKRVEFVGLPNPFFDPAVMAMRARGELTPKRRAALTQMEQRRQMRGFCRVPGVTVRRIGTDHGLSRDYRWDTSNNFVVEMDIADIERLRDTMHTDPSMRAAHRQAFRVLDEIIVI